MVRTRAASRFGARRRPPILRLVAISVLGLGAGLLPTISAHASMKTHSGTDTIGNRSSSSRSSTKSSSRSSARDSESSEDSGSRTSTSRSRSSSRGSTGRSSHSGSSRSRSSGGGRSSSSRGHAAWVPPPPLSSRQAVRERGTVLPQQAVDKRNCRQESTVGGGDSYFHCGNEWYATVKAPDSVSYVEIAPPPGIRVTQLSERAVVLSGSAGGRYYLDGDTFYRAAAANEGGGYLIVEPPSGLTLQRLPSGAENAIPIVSEGITYYAYDGRFYRRTTDPHGRPVYELTVSPF